MTGQRASLKVGVGPSAFFGTVLRGIHVTTGDAVHGQSKERVAAMKHPDLHWNTELQEWFCVRCGLISDHVTREDAWAELALVECELPTVNLEIDRE